MIRRPAFSRGASGAGLSSGAGPRPGRRCSCGSGRVRCGGRPGRGETSLDPG